MPVLPVVVAGGSAGTSRARPYLIIAGLVVSFSLAVLVGSTVPSALGLPQNSHVARDRAVAPLAGPHDPEGR